MWIFTLFSSITLITFNDDKAQVILNLAPLHQKVILLLGEYARRIYLLPEELALSDIQLNQKNWLKWCGM
jgi:hypothetical protein